jgi:TonB family protein
MTRQILWLPIALTVGCSSGASDRQPPDVDVPELEPPVVINPNPPVEYPLDLFNRKIEGTVVLRLYLDSEGVLVPDSTRIAESSGHAALDSAALIGVANMRFAPARHRGVPTATAFLQPVHFRQPPTGTGSDDI